MPNPEITFTISPNQQSSISTTLTAGTIVYQATDTTLSHNGQPADAAAVGEAIDLLEASDADLNAGIVANAGDISDIQTAMGLLVPKSDIETTLTTSGKVADSKATGDAIAAAVTQITGMIDATLTESGKIADAGATGTKITEAIATARTDVVLTVENIAVTSGTHNVDLSSLLATTSEVQTMVGEVIAGT